MLNLQAVNTRSQRIDSHTDTPDGSSEDTSSLFFNHDRVLGSLGSSVTADTPAEDVDEAYPGQAGRSADREQEGEAFPHATASERNVSEGGSGRRAMEV